MKFRFSNLKFVLINFLFFCFLNCFIQRNAFSLELMIIPTPKIINQKDGKFIISRKTRLVVDNNFKNILFSAKQLDECIKDKIGVKLRFDKKKDKNVIVLGKINQNARVDAEIKNASLKIPFELGDEGYFIDIDANRILIAAMTDAGVFYGVQTLKQVIAANSSNGTIECMQIFDKPDLKYRGWQDDISRGPIPTLDFLKEQVVKLSAFKLNFLTLYTEHVFKLKNHPTIAPKDGITKEEIKELIDFAKDYHVEIVGNFQSFGHMKNILSNPKYKHLAETRGLITPAKEESYRFLKDVYSEVASAYESRLFNINCDETVGLGKGYSRRLVQRYGFERVYANHINRLSKLLTPYDKQIMLWGDIAFQHPKIINLLPKDAIVLLWGYEVRSSYRSSILPFKNSGVDFMIAPGVSCWREIFPNIQKSVINIYNFINDGANLGTMGVLNTTWDDDGENFFHNNWYALAWGGELSWSSPNVKDPKNYKSIRSRRIAAFNKAFNSFYYESQHDVVKLFYQLSGLRYLSVKNSLKNKGFWNNNISSKNKKTLLAQKKNNQKLLERAKKIIGKLHRVKKDVKKNSDDIDYAIFAAKRVLFIAKKNIYQIDLTMALLTKDEDLMDSLEDRSAKLMDDVRSLGESYSTLWKKENREWWLENNLTKYRELIRRFALQRAEVLGNVNNGTL